MSALVSWARTFVEGAVVYIREELGYPAGLIQLLEQRPEIRVELSEPKPCIEASSVTRWDRIGGQSPKHWPHLPQGTLKGWRWTGGEYRGFEMRRPEYADIAQCTIMEHWSCDIAAVHGFSSSKSDLSRYSSTDEMVEAKSRDMIDEISPAKLQKNLAHKEIRILPEHGGTDYFARYQWDGRLWLMNSGGSHHFAAAKYIARRLSHPVPLTGKLYSYSLNAAAIESVRRDFEMFVISNETSIGNAFFNAMNGFRATWLWHEMPWPFEGAKAILLPRSEKRSMRVAAELRRAGVLDLGEHLAALAARRPAGGTSAKSGSQADVDGAVAT
jgi:hypothetical protein